jgi:cell division protein FtsB
MTSSSASEPKKVIINSRPLCLFFVVAIGLSFALFGDKGAWRLTMVRQQQAALMQKSQQLQAENLQLRAEIDALQNDDRYLEQVARSRLGLVRDGELVYQFLPQRQ